MDHQVEVRTLFVFIFTGVVLLPSFRILGLLDMVSSMEVSAMYASSSRFLGEVGYVRAAAYALFTSVHVSLSMAYRS